MNKGLVIFLLFNVILGAVFASFNVPILGWSSNKLFTSDSISEKYTHEQYKSLIQSIIKDNSVETITVFVEPKLRSDQLSTLFDSYSSDNNGGSFKNLKKSFENSNSNVFIPYSESGVLSIFSQLKSIVKGTIFVAKEQSTLINIQGAENILLSESSKIVPTLSNNVVDIVIVILGHNQDETIKQFQSVVEKASYVSFFTSESAQEFDVKSTFDKQIQENKSLLTTNMENEEPTQSPTQSPTPASSGSSNPPKDEYFNYFTGPIIETYLIVSILLAILVTGLCCITDLQVPDRYEAPSSKKNL